MEISGLHPTGVTKTHPAVQAWAEQVTNNLKAKLSGPVTATLWPYRIGKHEYLACDIGDAQGNDYSITFNVGLPLDCHFDPHSCDPATPDMAEAMHMASIVLQSMDAVVTVGRKPRKPAEEEVPG